MQNDIKSKMKLIKQLDASIAEKEKKIAGLDTTLAEKTKELNELQKDINKLKGGVS